MTDHDNNRDARASDITAPGVDVPADAQIATADQPVLPPAKRRSDGLVAWATGSLAFLGYIALGSMNTRTWDENPFLNTSFLDIEPRRIVDVWVYQANNLPDFAPDWFLNGLFYASLIVMILGTVAGLWYTLDRAGTSTPSEKPASDQRSFDVDRSQ